MDVLNNKDLIFKEIDRKIEAKLLNIKKEYKQKLESIKETIEQEYSLKIKYLKEKHKNELEMIEKQLRSNFELNSKKTITEAQHKLISRVIDRLKEKNLVKLYKLMIKELQKKTKKKFKEIKVPHNVKIKGSKSTLNEQKVIAKTSEEIYEYDLEEFIDNRMNIIYSIVEKELF